MNKVKINGKEFYVFSTAECLVTRHNLCVAVEPWGEISWGTEKNGQKILDAIDNRNPESLTYEWFQSLSEDVKSAMLTVRDHTYLWESVTLFSDRFYPLFVPLLLYSL